MITVHNITNPGAMSREGIFNISRPTLLSTRNQSANIETIRVGERVTVLVDVGYLYN